MVLEVHTASTITKQLCSYAAAAIVAKLLLQTVLEISPCTIVDTSGRYL